MALSGTEEIRNGLVVIAATGQQVVVTTTPVEQRNGFPTDADGRLCVVQAS